MKTSQLRIGSRNGVIGFVVSIFLFLPVAFSFSANVFAETKTHIISEYATRDNTNAQPPEITPLIDLLLLKDSKCSLGWNGDLVVENSVFFNASSWTLNVADSSLGDQILIPENEADLEIQWTGYNTKK
jgi:hypothetical protein